MKMRISCGGSKSGKKCVWKSVYTLGDISPHRIRDVIYESYYYSNDTAVLIPAIREIVDNS